MTLQRRLYCRDEKESISSKTVTAPSNLTYPRRGPERTQSMVPKMYARQDLYKPDLSDSPLTNHKKKKLQLRLSSQESGWMFRTPGDGCEAWISGRHSPMNVVECSSQETSLGREDEDLWPIHFSAN
ncbi:hypothetical protein E2C01_034165 [Portunus trituberculatus]|uniref:Uncharacterized protein n=1 Tax=Portunus trituberculatus TaxID=210409 RepID=A0A5B7F6A5_PORTR|nr:hypothetical protein [Portunus trituberculatus]